MAEDRSSGPVRLQGRIGFHEFVALLLDMGLDEEARNVDMGRGPYHYGRRNWVPETWQVEVQEFIRRHSTDSDKAYRAVIRWNAANIVGQSGEET